MLRRDFIKMAAVSALSPIHPGITYASDRSEQAASDVAEVPLLKTFTAEDHRRRLRNIQLCEQLIRGCAKRHLITGYIPGQAAYGVGEYPNRKPYRLGDEYDERVLDGLQADGIRLIQIMEEWNDLLRLFGGNKFTAVNPTGLRRLIDMAHRRGIKVLIYCSSGYMQHGDPDLREEWIRDPEARVRDAWWNLVRCSPASPGWRAYLLPRMIQILDEYGADGLYNDWGYRRLAEVKKAPAKDEVIAFEETREHDAALEDLTSMMYSEVKRRGGIYKMHCDGARPNFNSKLYDYLWVGEGMSSIDRTRVDTKDYPPYLVPCFDFGAGSVPEDEQYLQAIPYMQFPLRLAGRPYTGEKVTVPGVHYNQNWFYQRQMQIWQYTREHPNGPFMYGQWDSFPPRPDRGEVHARWLALYAPMVGEGTRAYVEIKESDFLHQDLPEEVVATIYANRDLYLVLANYGKGSNAEIKTRHSYVSVAEPESRPKHEWTVKARSLQILRRVDVEAK